MLSSLLNLQSNMNQADYEIVRDAMLQTAADIETAKRPAYVQGNIDVLHNFKTNAERMGITPLQCAGIYWGKHVDAITSYLKDPNIHQAEPIHGRIADCINYLKLITALIKEQDYTK